MATNVDITTSEPHPSVFLLTISGELDESNLGNIEKYLDPIVGGSHKAVLLYSSGLTYINSSVIGYFAKMHNSFLDNSQEFAFVSVNESLFEILDLVGMTNIINSYDTVDEAIAEIDL